jgi:hypothetical protein
MSVTAAHGATAYLTRLTHPNYDYSRDCRTAHAPITRPTELEPEP